MTDEEKLLLNLSCAWQRDTSSDPHRWTPENPAWGQCAVTACAVQDVLGGEVVWAEAQTPEGERISHYFNRLADGSVRDMTRRQFPQGTVLTPPEGQAKTRGRDGTEFATTKDYVLSFPATQRRYEILQRFMKE